LRDEERRAGVGEGESSVSRDVEALGEGEGVGRKVDFDGFVGVELGGVES